MTGRPMTEKALQAHVEAAARQLGWSAYHAWISIRSEPGYPDLTLVRDGRLLYVELKAERGSVTPAQMRWLIDLASVPCAEVYVWRPGEWTSGEIAAVLAGKVGGQGLLTVGLPAMVRCNGHGCDAYIPQTQATEGEVNGQPAWFCIDCVDDDADDGARYRG